MPLEQVISTGSVLNTSAYGSPSLALGVLLGGITSATAFGSPSLALSVLPNSVANTNLLGSPSIALSVSPDSVANANLFGTALTTLDVEPVGIASTQTTGVPKVDYFATSSGIAPTLVFGTPVLTWDQFVVTAGIPSSATIGNMTTDAIYREEELHNAIRTHFSSNVSIPIAYANVAFNPPTTGLWCSLSINARTANQIGFGLSNDRRTFGAVEIEAFTDQDVGDGDLLEFVDSMRVLFRDVSIGDAVFRQSTVSAGNDPAWHSKVVTCPFYVDAATTPVVSGSMVSGALDLEYAHNKIRSRFKTQIEDGEGIPVLYDNAGGTPPNDGAWIALSIIDGSTERTAWNRYRTVGIVDASVFVPVDTGDALAQSLSDRILRAFAPATFDGVKYRNPYATTIGSVDRWWRITVTCPFSVDETN